MTDIVDESRLEGQHSPDRLFEIPDAPLESGIFLPIKPYIDQALGLIDRLPALAIASRRAQVQLREIDQREADGIEVTWKPFKEAVQKIAGHHEVKPEQQEMVMRVENLLGQASGLRDAASMIGRTGNRLAGILVQFIPDESSLLIGDYTYTALRTVAANGWLVRQPLDGDPTVFFNRWSGVPPIEGRTAGLNDHVELILSAAVQFPMGDA